MGGIILPVTIYKTENQACYFEITENVENGCIYREKLGSAEGRSKGFHKTCKTIWFDKLRTGITFTK